MDIDHDIIICGGGLSGLWCAIELATDYNVLLIDPDSYPRHKMCGEYISAEIEQLLESKGIYLQQLTNVHIKDFKISLEGGSTVAAPLPLGGYGISRHCLDHFLYQKAQIAATIIKDKATHLEHHGEFQKVITSSTSYTCKQVIVATGKRSVMDKSLNRTFFNEKSNWLAVKMHYKFHMSAQEVQLHNFDGGYAGISTVEDNTVNLCYLTTFKSFQKFKDIDQFNKHVLSKNPHLKSFFNTAQPLWDKPITISQIAFGKKDILDTHYLFVGDTAGLIHPLCGNGMAMALHSAHLASNNVRCFLNGATGRDVMITNYGQEWSKNFSSRMRYGSLIQKMLLRPKIARLMYRVLAIFPFLLPHIIKKTHGKPIFT